MQLKALWKFPALIAAFFLITTSVATASTVQQLSLEELTKASDVVAVVDVVSVVASVENGKVFTDIELRVIESMKGSQADAKLHIKHVGGRTKTLATYVPGMPAFRVGHKALVFLENVTSHGHHVVTGMSQGKFDVVVGPDGSTQYIVPATNLPHLVRRSPDGKSPLTPTRKSSMYDEIHSLTVFKETIRRHVQ